MLSSDFRDLLDEDGDLDCPTANNDVNDAILDQDDDDDDDIQKSIKETLASCYRKDKIGFLGLKNAGDGDSPRQEPKLKKKPQIRKIVWDLEDWDLEDKKEKKRKKVIGRNDEGQSSNMSFVNIPASSSSSIQRSPSTSNQYPLFLSGISQSNPFR